MNQHFLYNILNHIQYFINKGEKDASLAYIARLSRLLRQWMDSVEKHRIPAESEIILLRDYLSLEAIRFPGRFTFEVNNRLHDAQRTFLRPHIIFPLAEQAVHCMLKHPVDDNHIDIVLAEDGPFVKATISARSGYNGPQYFEVGAHIVPHQNK